MAFYLETKSSKGVWLRLSGYSNYFSAMCQLEKYQKKNLLGNYQVVEYPPQIPKSHIKCKQLLKELKGE